MSIVPVSSLSPSELHLLGNNLKPKVRKRSRLAAINRSLAIHGEQVQKLFAPALPVFISLPPHTRSRPA